jgi:hypothetical protein
MNSHSLRIQLTAALAALLTLLLAANVPASEVKKQTIPAHVFVDYTGGIGSEDVLVGKKETKKFEDYALVLYLEERGEAPTFLGMQTIPFA